MDESGAMGALVGSDNTIVDRRFGRMIRQGRYGRSGDGQVAFAVANAYDFTWPMESPPASEPVDRCAMPTSRPIEERFWIVFLAMIAAVPALSTDMYLPAIPIIADQWGQPVSRVSLSLVLWFVCFSAMLLIYGPLSDKYGRKPVLLAGLGLFVGASAACGLAGNVWQLIAFRLGQSLGAAGPSAMCMAICRDRFEGSRRKHVLAWIGIILSIAPMAAPSIGALLLKHWTWRTIFWVQAGLGIPTLLLSIAMPETAAARTSRSWSGLLGRYAVLMRNRRYMLDNSVMGLIGGPFFGFIGFAPIAYITIFGLTEQQFGVMFALNPLVSMLGAFVCTRVAGRHSDRRILTWCLVGSVVGGVGILVLGARHFLLLGGFAAVMSFCCGVSRPLKIGRAHV